MGTILYGASSGAPAITPAIVQAGWTFTSAAIQRKIALLSADATGAVSWGPDTSRTGGPQSSCLGQWIYGPIAAQTFGGTLALSMFGRSTTFTNYFDAAMAAWIAKPDGSLRANLLAATEDPAQATWTTTLQKFTVPATNLLNNASLSGDYLVVEAGDNAIANFVSADGGTIGAGNARVIFTFSNSIQAQGAVANGATVWLGRPHPRGT